MSTEQIPNPSIARMGNKTMLERRRATRVVNTAPFSPRSACRVIDISPFGCGLAGVGSHDCQVGQFVQLRFDETLTVRAIVRWSGEDRLGLEFTRPLASAEIEKALASAPPIGFSRV